MALDKEVIKTERGWAGHFCAADLCLFRRNTLLEYEDIKLVISTVGAYKPFGKFNEIGYNRFYETMVFQATLAQDIYWDADVTKEISFDSNWAIDKIGDDSDMLANDMHECVVAELTKKLINNEINIKTD